MASEKGQLTTCDRCGCSIFRKYIGTGEADGGYTKWDKFEPLPETWLDTWEIGCLCETCAYVFRSWVTDFMNGKVTPKWDKAIHFQEAGDSE